MAREFNFAASCCIASVQHDYYGNLYDHIKNLKGKPCYSVKFALQNLFSPIYNLNVFCDERGVLKSH